MKLTARGLENAAVHYLQRYPSSRANLRRVLERKIARARARGDERTLEDGALDDVVETMERAGLLDDAGYARGLARSLFGRGLAQRAIRARLRQKGVGADDIDAALRALELGDEVDPDLVAARAFCQRKKLGALRTRGGHDDPRKQQQRDLAALARAGFAYGVARRALDETRGDDDDD